jgi:hypothetical protein
LDENGGIERFNEERGVVGPRKEITFDDIGINGRLFE